RRRFCVSGAVAYVSSRLLYLYGSGDQPVPHSFPTRRSSDLRRCRPRRTRCCRPRGRRPPARTASSCGPGTRVPRRWSCRCPPIRSEEHTSELQSRENLVCRLLLEKKKAALATNCRAYTV